MKLVTFACQVFIVLLFGALCKSERILFLLPIASSSHVHVFEPLIRALGKRGHDIVTISPMISSEMPETVRQIQITSLEDIEIVPDAIQQRGKSWLEQFMNSTDTMEKPCMKAVSHPKLHEILNSKEKYDLVVVDILWNFCVLGVIPILKAPSIFISTLATPPIVANVVGNRLPPSFVPSMFLRYGDQMSFTERMSNALLETLFTYFWDKMLVRKGERLYREHFPNGQSLPGIDEILKNTSLVLTNSHFTLTYPRPLLPDVIEVGGMHTRPPKPLPKDLDEFLNGSGEHGFIFFSLGSICKGKYMPESTRKVFINVFSKLKQRVVWKWDGEAMPDLPQNAMLGKWLPQQDILGHSKIKLFMTHGGLLSTQESVYHGVPVLGLPLFADQDLNVRMAERRGYAKFVEIVDLTEERLEAALFELLNNPKYSLKVKELSKLTKDLPQSPVEKAVYWVEYVLRHKGAPHLRSAARDLSFSQYFILDVVAALIAVVLVTLLIIVKCCKACCKRTLFKKGKKKND